MSKVKEKLNDHKILKIVLIVIFILAALCAISGINKPHFSPFSTEIKLNYPGAMAINDTNGALIDTQGKRLLIAENQQKVTAMVDTEDSGSPVDRLNGVTVYGDKIYAFGSTQYNKGIYLSAEKVLTYNLKGEYLETLYEQTYGEDDFVSTPSFINLMVDNTGVFLTCIKGKNATVINLIEGNDPIYSIDFPEIVTTAGYFNGSKVITCIGKYMNCYKADVSGGSIDTITLSEMIQFISEEMGFDLSAVGIDKMENYQTFPVVVYDTDGKAQVLIFANENTGQSLLVSNSGKISEVAESISCSTGLFIKNLLFWLSVALIAISVLIFLIWLAIKKLRGKGRMVILIIGAILLTTLFYTYNDALEVKKTYGQIMNIQAEQFAAVITENCGDILTAIREEGVENHIAKPENQEKMTNLDAFLGVLCSKNGIEHPVQAQIFLKDQDGTTYSFSGSTAAFSGERVVLTDELQQNVQNNTEGEILSVSNIYETYYYAVAPFYAPDNSVAGTVTIACYQGNLIYSYTQEAINLFVSLVAIFVAIYVSSSAFKTFGADIKRMRKREKIDQSGRSVDMAGILMFLNSFGYFIDSAIVVYVAQSLCVDMDPAKQAILVALPFSMASAGSLLGNFLYTPIKKKLGDRSIAMIGATIALGSLILLAFSIQITNIYLYIVGKFIYGFATSGFLYVLCDTLPYAEKNKTAQKKAINSVIQAGGAAGILSCLAGGYIAEYLSYSAIYLLGAVFVVAWLIIAIIVFKNKKHKTKDKGLAEAVAPEVPKGSFAEYWKIFLKGPMLMYICFYFLPCMLEGGYSSYLFPLYTASAGISALLLSNISVFAKALVYSCNDAVRHFTEKLNPNVALIMPMLLICAGLLCFYLSPNIYWAIAMMFAFKLLERMPSIGKKMYISETAQEYGLDPQLVQSNYYSVESGMYVFQSPILSAFVNLGMNLACTAVGAVSAVLFTIFGVYNKSRTKKKEEIQPVEG